MTIEKISHFYSFKEINCARAQWDSKYILKVPLSAYFAIEVLQFLHILKGSPRKNVQDLVDGRKIKTLATYWLVVP